MEKIQALFKIQSRLTLVAFMSLLMAFTGCKSKDTKGDSAATKASTTDIVNPERLAKAEDEISVMTFNVENMFDNLHDKGTEDYTYLPRAQKGSAEVAEFCMKVKSKFYREECNYKDWNDEIVAFKLSQVGKTIKYIDHGKGPDIILMAEVENLNILNQLVDTQLKDFGYQTRVLIEGPDLRGIDPAIISKFPLKGKPVLHLIPYKDENPEQLKYAKRSRGVIEATVILPNKKELTVMAVHFPSQANPTEWRKQAIEFVKNKMLEYEKKGRAVIAGGDMNTTATEEGRNGYFSKIFSQAGPVSHLVGCDHCKGSHNYKGEWSFLDVMVYGNSISKAGLTLIPESIQVVITPDNSIHGSPLRFDDEKKEGVADHFPLYSRLKISSSKKK
ncbi:endonuclease/exonuclease/phosphatase family protein [Pseudobdellovibrio sp. HCB154]|uniref:endonuclease/exonuclease/phosphatase family protein n=1 Tax=Pseudobdellovibrio sp. HCB154 TaxID=3386277 RepID=UPI003916D96F